jgi:pimeloyl-ACP methyl ester carboxylesterase
VVRSTEDEKVGDLGMPAPYVELPRRSTAPRAAVLVLHGGKAESRDPVAAGQLTVRRMQPFARDLAALGDDLAVAQLRYRMRGWNVSGDDALADVAFALAAVDTAYGGVPTVLVGHSMGGRAALRAAGYPTVRGVVALAPWLPGAEPVEQLAGRDVVVLHGTRDLTTSPRASERFMHRALPFARRAVCLHVPWSGHGMLLRASTWHRLTASFVAAIVDDASFDRPLAQARAAHARDVTTEFGGTSGGGA